MPITTRANGSAPLFARPDHDRALRRIRALPLDAAALGAAEMTVQKTRTSVSAKGYGLVLANVLRYMVERGIDPLAPRPQEAVLWWAGTAAYAPKTRNQMLAVAKAFYSVAIELDLIRKNPMDSITPLRNEVVTPTPALTVEQATELFESIAADVDHPDRGLVAHRDLVAVGFATRMCLRAGEIPNLRWQNVASEPEGRTIVFVGKWNKPAKLAIPDDLWEVITAWRLAYEAATGGRFTGRDPIIVGLGVADIAQARERAAGVALKALDSKTISSIAMRRLRAIGLDAPRMAAHALRATGATLAYEAGADILEVQALLRHSSLDMTKQYLKRIDSSARAGMERMPMRLGPPSQAGGAA